jgi:hypothetical protein
MFDREAFWEALLGGESTDPVHVEIANAIFDEWERRDPQDARWLAYILATALDDHSRCNQPDIQTGCVNLMSGMIGGEYTGKRLEQFFAPGWSAWVPARAVVDMALGDAETVATDAKLIYTALSASSNVSLPEPAIEITEVPGTEPDPPVEGMSAKDEDGPRGQRG